MAAHDHSHHTCGYHEKDVCMVCRTCNGEYICFKCVGTLHKGHMIAPMKKPKRSVLSTVCPKHGRNFIYVCRTCDKQFLCKSCFYPWHRGHVCSDFQAYMKHMREKLLKMSETNQQTQLDAVTKQIKQKRDDLKIQVDSVADKMMDEFVKVEKKIQRKKQVASFRALRPKLSEIENVFGKLSM